MTNSSQLHTRTRKSQYEQQPMRQHMKVDCEGIYIVTSEATSAWIDDSYTIRVDTLSTHDDEDAFDFLYPNSDVEEITDEPLIIVYKYSDEDSVEYFRSQEKAVDYMIDWADTQIIS